MIKLNHYYSHKADWHHETSKRIGAKLINNKTVILPQNIAEGISYFSPIIEGVSIVLLDALFTNDTIIKRLESDDDLYILQFDIREKINTVNIIETKNKSAHENFKSGFSVFHSSIGNTFKPVNNQRVFALRLLIDKNKLIDLLIQKDNTLKNIEKKILFYNHLNSNSKLLIHGLKEKSVFDLDFDTYIKGISLKLLANFINTYTNPNKENINKIEAKALNNTRDYLVNNLYDNFPSVPFLSEMARMSHTKYKVTFKKIYHISPNQFFNNQKMILANQLLESGAFSSINEVSQTLNYCKSSYFSRKYINYFGRKPSSDFKKKLDILT